MHGFKAFYFDGRSSRRYDVEVFAHNGRLFVAGDTRFNVPLSQVNIHERMQGKTCKMILPNGAYIETSHKEDFENFLLSIGHVEPIAVRMHRRWTNILWISAFLILFLLFSYFYILPWSAKFIAKNIPESAQISMGREVLSYLDGKILSKTKLTREEQNEIKDFFANLMPPKANPPKFEIVFRKSKIGPNAFALPSNQIVLTDELVELLDGDNEAIAGVLAHELGHLHERHLMQRLIQGSVIGAVTLVLFGDASSILATVTTGVGMLRYSRDAEREADDYAIAMLKYNGIDLEKLAFTFEMLEGYDSVKFRRRQLEKNVKKAEENLEKARSEWRKAKEDFSVAQNDVELEKAKEVLHKAITKLNKAEMEEEEAKEALKKNMEKEKKSGKKEKSEREEYGYISTHPSTKERIERIRKAAAAR